MEKKEVIEKLKADAARTARLDKKVRQFVFIFIPLFIIILVSYTLIYWGIIPSYNGNSLGGIVIAVMLILLASSRFLPLGKISEEKVNKYFQEKLSSKLKANQGEIDEINTRKFELEEELKILNEI